MGENVLDAETHPPLSADQIGLLVVEDDALLRWETGQALSVAGLAVFAAQDATEAIEVLTHRDDVRVLITDVTMPTGTVDGYQLTAMVTARWPQIGILVVSGAERPHAGELPVGVRFLSKPCRERDLVAAVFEVVSRQTQAT